ncbi:MAG TPA: hypothetical protein VE967_10605 [Gemmatimonadaceae bacterium]|nr:hypothetical protein [Gemmatimonadaceae bacterium]
MKAPERLQLGPPGEREGPRDRRGLVISIVIHVAVFTLLSGVAVIPALEFMRMHEKPPKVIPERVLFVKSPVPPKRDTGTVRKKQPPPEQKRDEPQVVDQIIAPPAGAPPSGAGAVRPDSGSAAAESPPIGGGGRGLPGLSPGVKDPRLIPGPIGPRIDPTGPLSSAYRGADSVMHAWVQAYWDSLAVSQANAGRAPGDWTVQKNGKKYGVDQQWIYFGKFKLPTMLLALLPVNTTANPTLVEKQRALESMRWEINFQAQRAMNQEGFQEAVQALRERKQAERKAQGKQ